MRPTHPSGPTHAAPLNPELWEPLSCVPDTSWNGQVRVHLVEGLVVSADTPASASGSLSGLAEFFGLCTLPADFLGQLPTGAAGAQALNAFLLRAPVCPPLLGRPCLEEGSGGRRRGVQPRRNVPPHGHSLRAGAPRPKGSSAWAQHPCPASGHHQPARWVQKALLITAKSAGGADGGPGPAFLHRDQVVTRLRR